MLEDDLIIGVWDRPGATGNADFAAKCRDFTISTCRFDYFGPIVEADSVDEILERASRTGQRYCLVQSSGHVMIRYRDPERSLVTHFIHSLAELVASRDFLVAGGLVDGQDRWYGLDELCFVVDLELYRELGRPEFQRASPGKTLLPASRATFEDAPGGPALRALRPVAGEVAAEPRLPGWGLIAASLRHGKAVCDFDDVLRRCRYDLRAKAPEDVEVFRRYRGEGILRYGGEAAGDGANEDWRGFLDFVKDQARHAKRGVFLGNWEDYRDVASPPPGFSGPVSAFYGVAAGFKANRILETHGFDENTRVVFFDYSPIALGLKKAQVEEWDGTDFPAFIARVGERFPDAFYQLWGNARAGTLDLDIVAALWEKELESWGGERSFQRHWRRSRRLSHRFVQCDLFANPRPLLDAVEPAPNAVMWWSNAFHSLNCVWFYEMDERRRIYRRWIEDVSAINPQMLLYGKDCDNLEIGGTRVADHLSPDPPLPGGPESAGEGAP